MEKIKFIADTACDIPDEDMQEYQIDLPSVPITVDTQGFFERRSFSMVEFYDVMEKAAELPTTSRVPVEDYLSCYQRAYEEGYTHIFSVTINAGGSGTHTSAQMAKDLFFQKNPGAEIDLRVIDSKTYSMAYGYPVVEAAKQARSGATAAEIQAYLDDWFDSVDVYLGCYTLENAKRSGRIGAAAAFVGDVLGLRPVIRMVDGTTKIVEKVRGDKNLVPKIFQAYLKNREHRDSPVIIIKGSLDEPATQLQNLMVAELGHEVPVYNLGASIAINSGSKVIAVAVKGNRRPAK